MTTATARSNVPAVLDQGSRGPGIAFPNSPCALNRTRDAFVNLGLGGQTSAVQWQSFRNLSRMATYRVQGSSGQSATISGSARVSGSRSRIRAARVALAMRTSKTGTGQVASGSTRHEGSDSRTSGRLSRPAAVETRDVVAHVVAAHRGVIPASGVGSRSRGRRRGPEASLGGRLSGIDEITGDPEPCQGDRRAVGKMPAGRSSAVRTMDCSYTLGPGPGRRLRGTEHPGRGLGPGTPTRPQADGPP